MPREACPRTRDQEVPAPGACAGKRLIPAPLAFVPIPLSRQARRRGSSGTGHPAGTRPRRPTRTRLRHRVDELARLIRRVPFVVRRRVEVDRRAERPRRERPVGVVGIGDRLVTVADALDRGDRGRRQRVHRPPQRTDRLLVARHRADDRQVHRGDPLAHPRGVHLQRSGVLQVRDRRGTRRTVASATPGGAPGRSRAGSGPGPGRGPRRCRRGSRAGRRGGTARRAVRGRARGPRARGRGRSARA